ncbi:uncharacterized protein N7515_004038 [Penicillium bovifimosum]|uniref:Uncharacterized protein n=1 Tax=Penicillium bovifimosum TaxID=126998 RepID=A0A9W9H5R7_9EURO|nr:uncharacterized protein N7515_004038 [Penicillium bovifimosum]KAJ5139190.1 hypothetical protein N7515_004038 [Penicillium bovifimosum]
MALANTNLPSFRVLFSSRADWLAELAVLAPVEPFRCEPFNLTVLEGLRWLARGDAVRGGTALRAAAASPPASSPPAASPSTSSCTPAASSTLAASTPAAPTPAASPSVASPSASSPSASSPSASSPSASSPSASSPSAPSPQVSSPPARASPQRAGCRRFRADGWESPPRKRVRQNWRIDGHDWEADNYPIRDCSPASPADSNISIADASPLSPSDMSMQDAPSPDNDIQMQDGSSPGSHMSIDDVPSPAASSLQSEISMTDCAAHQIDSQDVEMSRTPTPPQQEKPVVASVLPRRPSPVIAGPSTTKEVVPSVVAAPGQGVAGYQDMAAPVESTDAKNKGNGKGKERDPGNDTMADGPSTNANKDGQASTSASQEMSTSSEQQAAWYGQLEDHSLKRIKEDRRARRLPALTDFSYDQLGQYQLVFDNFSKLYGSFGRTTAGSSFVLAAWRKLGTVIWGRTFSNPDTAIKQHLHDAVNILALLRAEKSAIRSISELRNSVREVLEKGGGS